MGKYDGKSSSVLGELLEYARSDLETLKSNDTPDAAAIAKKETDIEAMTKALIQAVSKPTTSSTTSTDYEGYRIRGAISDRVRQINVFHGSGPQELSQFLEKLTQVYKEYVSSNPTAYEGSFVRDAKCQLSAGIHSNLTNSKETITTFDQFKKWLRKTYNSQLTAFQLLGAAWYTEFKTSDKFVIYAQTVEKELRTARDFIMAEYERRNKSKMTTEQVFDLIGAMLMTEKLKMYQPTIYRAMVKQMDGLETATAVATPAECYRDRFGGETMTGDPPHEAYHASDRSFRTPKKSNGTCITLSHDELDRLIEEKVKSLNGGNDPDSGYSGKKSKKGQKRNRCYVTDNKVDMSGDHGQSKTQFTPDSVSKQIPIRQPTLGEIMGDFPGADFH